jgi:hypothetical protein
MLTSTVLPSLPRAISRAISGARPNRHFNLGGFSYELREIILIQLLVRFVPWCLVYEGATRAFPRDLISKSERKRHQSWLPP